MKNLWILFICLTGLTFSNCSDDDFPHQEYIGTWIGNEECIPGTPREVEISITAKGSDKISIDGGQFKEDELTVDNNSFDSTIEISIMESIHIYGDLSDDSLTIHRDHTVGGFVGIIKCSYLLGRQ